MQQDGAKGDEFITPRRTEFQKNLTPRAIHGTGDEMEIQTTNSSTHIEEELSDSDSEVVVPQKPRQKQKRIASSENEDDWGTIHSYPPKLSVLMFLGKA